MLLAAFFPFASAGSASAVTQNGKNPLRTTVASSTDGGKAKRRIHDDTGQLRGCQAARGQGPDGCVPRWRLARNHCGFPRSSAILQPLYPGSAASHTCASPFGHCGRAACSSAM